MSLVNTFFKKLYFFTPFFTLFRVCRDIVMLLWYNVDRQQLEQAVKENDRVSYDLCIFDLDGTLTDPGLGITKAYRYALASFGIHEELDDLTRFIGPPLRSVFNDVYGFSDSDTEKAVAMFREYYSTEGLFENIIYPGIPELLQYLVDNEKILAVATNKVRPYTTQILKHFKLESYFIFVSADEMDGSLTRNGKRDIIQAVLEAIDPERKLSAAIIGDRKNDVHGARETGIHSIGVTWGYGSREELLDAGATHLADTPDELRRLLVG